MRNTTLSTSFASVITQVINAVAVADVAVRSFLHHFLMREQLGYRLERRQPGFAGGSLDLGDPQGGDKRPALLQPAMAYGIAAQTVCLTHRLSQTRASWRG
jgi:hypothetical protein